MIYDGDDVVEEWRVDVTDSDNDSCGCIANFGITCVACIYSFI